MIEAAADQKAGALVLGGVMADRCGAILSEFFRKKREMGKK